MGSKKIMYELLERPLNIGDFVLELSDYTFRSSYGIVVSTKEIYTTTGIKKVDRVYKIENPVEKEIEIRERVLHSYSTYLTEEMNTKSMSEKHDRGDIVCKFESYAYKYYLCLGKVKTLLYSSLGDLLVDKEGIGYIFITTGYSKNSIPDFTSIDLESLFSKLTLKPEWNGKSNEFFILKKNSIKFVPVARYNITTNEILMNYGSTMLNMKLL